MAIEVSDRSLVALGRLTVNFGNLELYVALCVWALLGTDGPTSQIVTAELSFRARLDLLLSLARYKLDGDELLERILENVSVARTIEQARNGIVHAHWLTEPDRDVLTRMKVTAKTKGLNTTFEDLSAEQLNEFADRVRGLAERFALLGGDLLQRFDVSWLPRMAGPPTGPPNS